jgi:cytochrome c biogenesis protein CcmG/thiol:disulfide interchange protein DsbE
MKLKPMMLAPPLLFLGFAVFAAIGLFRDQGQGLPSTFIGKPAPPMTEIALEGYPAAQPEDFARGTVTLVNFWASWCPPCRAEHPRLLQMAKDGIPIIGVNFNDRAADARSYLEDDGNPFVAVPFDPEGRSAFDWGVSAPPETFILGPDGTVLFRFIGPLIGSDYEQRFLPALDAALNDATRS